MSTLSQKLGLKQSQDLVMTPQLQQAIKLLQLNNMELSEFIEGELEQNPFLEKPEGEDSDSNSDSERSEAKDESDDVDHAFDDVWTGNEAKAEESQFDNSNYMSGAKTGGSTSFDESDEGFENRMTSQTTLREHLLEQLHITFDDPRDMMIGTLLIDQLDESGYIREDQKGLAERLGCSEDRITRLLKEMKQFDPTGIFAHDLPECLALQLEERNRLDPVIQKLLDNLDLLGQYNYDKLRQICGADDETLQEMIAEIKALNPRPASDFDHFVVQTAIPDVIMRRLPKNLGGGWRVELNNDTLPRVLINQTYYTEVAQQAKNKSDKEYLNEQIQSANWLVKALDQRAKTILKVAGELIEQQEMFFLYGIEYLKPLTLKDIAEAIEMHESTVSRVTTNKYIGTPRGLFELKYFFSSALGGQTAGSEVHSSESVKARIKSLIDKEDPDKILSDDTIVDMLKGEGIDIARRTVAKYREALHIPSSVQRRRQKKR